MAVDHMDVAVEVDGRQLDVRVPCRVSWGRLTMLIGLVLAQQGVRLPDWWHLEIKDKPIHCADGDVLSDFAIGDGDTFVVTQSVPDEELKGFTGF